MLLILIMPVEINAVKPVFDLSNNMRLVMLPSDTKLGSVIYRLRASDADEDYPLQFSAFGNRKSSMSLSLTSGLVSDSGTEEVSDTIAITHVDCSTNSICEADVILTKALEAENDYYFSLEVKDSQGETTIVESHLQATLPIGAFQG